jgi:Spy/CpxP family protein refolding chaperone
MIRRHVWKLLLVLSLCLNVGFVTAMLLPSIRHELHKPLPDQLGLKEPVKSQFENNFSAFKHKVGPLFEQLRTERMKLLDLLASPNPSPRSIQAQEKAIQTVTAQIQDATVRHFLNQKHLLTPEQQKQFFDHLGRWLGKDKHTRRNPFKEKHS